MILYQTKILSDGSTRTILVSENECVTILMFASITVLVVPTSSYQQVPHEVHNVNHCLKRVVWKNINETSPALLTDPQERRGRTSCCW